MNERKCWTERSGVYKDEVYRKEQMEILFLLKSSKGQALV